MDLGLWNSIALWIIASFFLVLLLVTLFVGIPVLLDLKRAAKKAAGAIDEVRVKLDPVLHSARSVADDVQEMAATAKREAVKVGESVDRVSRRVDQLADLVETVQDEIQRPLLKSVAAIAGAKRILSRIL